MIKTFIVVVVLIISTSLPINHAGAEKVGFRKRRIQALYGRYEKKSFKKGWQKITVNINDLPRKVLWKGPKQSWKYGAIIVLHGGGGTYSNFSANIRIGKPMVNFSDLAISEGFAVFSPDSTDGLVTGVKGYSAGKRWDSLARDDRPNVDLPFIEAVITDIILKLRPANSAKDIFITGISNGGFMTILAATHFADKISAFAPVSAGDPYGTYMDMSKHRTLRPNAPGEFVDIETNKPISEKDACKAESYRHEKKWLTMNSKKKPPFKLFYHEGDGVDDTSCKIKVQRLLVEHGYKDDGSFVIKDDTGRRSILNHFWKEEYNMPLLEFFKKYANRHR